MIGELLYMYCMYSIVPYGVRNLPQIRTWLNASHARLISIDVDMDQPRCLAFHRIADTMVKPILFPV